MIPHRNFYKEATDWRMRIRSRCEPNRRLQMVSEEFRQAKPSDKSQRQLPPKSSGPNRFGFLVDSSNELKLIVDSTETVIGHDFHAARTKGPPPQMASLCDWQLCIYQALRTATQNPRRRPDHMIV